jgi:hypothetical protein
MRAKMQAICGAWVAQKSSQSAAAAAAATYLSKSNELNGEKSGSRSNSSDVSIDSSDGSHTNRSSHSSPLVVEAPLAWKVQISERVRDWRADCRSARISLAPRGYGRTSYHLSEIVQLVKTLRMTLFLSSYFVRQ